MAGQIVPRGENTWLVRVYLGRDPRTGKRLYNNKTVHGTKKAARTYLNGALREHDLGKFATAADTHMAALGGPLFCVAATFMLPPTVPALTKCGPIHQRPWPG